MIMLQIREATINDAEGIAKVHVDSWRTTYEGISLSVITPWYEHN